MIPLRISFFAQGRERSDLDKDVLFLSGILKQLEIIGEASVKISESTKRLYPDVPWITLTVEIPILYKKLEVITPDSLN